MKTTQATPRKKTLNTRQSLVEQFRSAIKEGEYRPGQTLPTEAELIKEHDLSRHNVRMAMLELVNEGLITRTPGQGTVVLRRKIRSRRITLVVQEPREWLAAGLAHGLMDTLREPNIRLELATCGDDQEEFDQTIRDVVESGSDGVVVSPLPWLRNHEWAFRLKQAGIPFVVNGILEGVETNVVSTDNYLGGQLAARHLIEQGYRRLYVVTPALASMADRQRLDGFLSIVAEYDEVESCLPIFFPLQQVDKREHQMPWLASQRAWKRYAERIKPSKPIGVFAINDFEAYGVCQASKELGLRIGPDIGVVGFDDRELARTCEPPLTTVQNRPEESGQRAGQMLMNQLESPETPISREIIEPKLIVRESASRSL